MRFEFSFDRCSNLEKCFLFDYFFSFSPNGQDSQKKKRSSNSFFPNYLHDMFVIFGVCVNGQNLIALFMRRTFGC